MTQRQRKSSNAQKPRTAKPLTLYLFSYNTLSALLWLRVFLGVLTALDLWNVLWLPNGRKLESVHANAVRVYGSLETWLRWTQTLQLIEVIHAAIALVKSPVSTTFIQVFTRTFQVWAICHAFPEVITTRPEYYAAMVFAWSSADVVRYSYFAALVSGRVDGGLFRLLKWLRYNVFLFLYPIGIAGEWLLIWNVAASLSLSSVVESTTGRSVLVGVFYVILGLYVPGALNMYMYMVKQRRKVLGRT